MTEFADATELGEAYRRGLLKPSEAVAAAIARVEGLNPRLNAIIHPTLEVAADRATALDAELDELADRLRDGYFGWQVAQPGPAQPALWGVPFAAKDLGCQQAGQPHHRGSALLAEAAWTEPSDSHLWSQLRDAGVVCLGRTNTPEFGSTITTEPLAYGATANPWNAEHSAGGSSGGSAAAVAAGLVYAAHGNDGGGSLRIPAAACGLVGLKPSRGRVSTGPQQGEHRGGLAVDGVLTRSVRDAAAFLDAISAPLLGDPHPQPAWGRTAVPSAGRTGRAQAGGSTGLLSHAVQAARRSGWPKELSVAIATDGATAPVVAAVESAARVLASLGHRVVGTSAPDGWFDGELADQLVVLRTAAMAAELDEWSTRLGKPVTEADVEPTNWFAAQLGATLPATALLAAMRWITRWRNRVCGAWRVPDSFAGDEPGRDSSDSDDGAGRTLGNPPIDLLVMPVLGDVTPKLGYLSDPQLGQQRLRSLLGFVDQVNASGQPAISLPMAHDPDGLPLGVQLVGAPGGEAVLVAVAQQLADAGALLPCEPATVIG